MRKIEARGSRRLLWLRQAASILANTKHPQGADKAMSIVVQGKQRRIVRCDFRESDPRGSLCQASHTHPSEDPLEARRSAGIAGWRFGYAKHGIARDYCPEHAVVLEELSRRL